MSLFDGGQPNTDPYVMRVPCRHCGHEKGRLEPTNGQNCVYCLHCGRHAYNAPKAETGEPQRTIRTRPDIKPSTRARILQRDSYRCVLCGHDDRPIHIGHCISVEEGLAAGANETELYDDENLAAMCEECNSGLGSRSVDLRLMLRLLQHTPQLPAESPMSVNAHPDQPNLLQHALDYAARGWPVLPLHTWNTTTCSCGHHDCASPAKHPRTRNGLKDATTNPEPIRSWWGRWPDANIGLRTGDTFDVLDIDGTDGFDSIDRIETEHGAAQAGPTSHTGGGGLHRLYQPTGLGNRAGILTHVDWRGANGYIVAPPSLHATGNRYEWAHQAGADTPLEPVTGWLHELLYPPARTHTTQQPGRIRSSGGTSEYGRRALEAEIAELHRSQPGTRNNTLNETAFNLYQLVAGGELAQTDVDQALNAAAEHIGLNQREAQTTIDSARKAGLGQPRSAPELKLVHTNKTASNNIPPHQLDPTSSDDPTTWEPIDIAAVLAGGCRIEPPAHLQRNDGTHLIYAAKLHAINGEPESGKSWFAQLIAHQTVPTGHVLYIDFEDSAESVLGRMLALGTNPDDLLARFTYLRPAKQLDILATDLLRTHFQTHRPVIAVLDGMTEAMSIFGLNPLDNADTAAFFRILPRRLARLGAAVIILDHVAKNSDDRGRWAIGAQHKMAVLDGAAYSVETAIPFGRNKAGIAKLIVTKDRPGYIRQHAAGTIVAELHMDSTDDIVTAVLRAPDGTHDTFRPSHIMENVSRVLEAGPALTKSAIRASVRGSKDHIDLAIQLLAHDGNIAIQRQGQGLWHSSVRPFRTEAGRQQEDTKDEETF